MLFETLPGYCYGSTGFSCTSATVAPLNRLTRVEVKLITPCILKNKFIAIAFVVAALIAGTRIAHAQTQAAIPASYFSMSMQSGVLGGQPWPTASFGGIRLWDTNTSWAELSASSGSYNWTNLDNWMAAAETHNVDMIYTFGNVPQWASSNPSDNSCSYGPGQCDAPSDLNTDGTGTDQNWKTFVTAVATHSAGRIKYWEIWNEPTNTGDWTGTTAQLARMGKDAYTIIKSIDPTAQVLSPSVSAYTTPGYGANIAQWLSGYFAAGGGAATDIVAFHGYYYTNAEDIVQIVTNIKAALAAAGQSGKPLWDTEASWGTSVEFQGWPANLSDTTAQASFLARYYLLQWSEGVSRFYWYSWNNSAWGTLWNPSTGTILPAGTAYIQVYKWLVGNTLTTPCAANASGVWTCMFTNTSGQQSEAVWNPAGSTSYQSGSQFTSYLDLTGATHSITANGSVTIGAEPILLVGNGSKAAATPVAVLNVSPQSGTAPVTVTANATASSESGGSIASYSINFGDGTTANAATATHTYSAAGTYNVALTVTDANGVTASASQTVSVTAPSQPSTSTGSSGITITSPANNTTVPNSVQFIASAAASSGNTITSMQILVDSVTYYNTGMNSVNTYIWIPSGQHTITVSARDNAGQTYSSTLTLTVGAASTSGSTSTSSSGSTSSSSGSSSSGSTGTSSGSTGSTTSSGGSTTSSTGSGAVTITAPANNATVPNSVQFVASATAASGKTINTMQILVDSVTYYNIGMSSLNTYVWIPSGQHNVTITAGDNSGKTYSSSINLGVQ